MKADGRSHSHSILLLSANGSIRKGEALERVKISMIVRKLANFVLNKTYFVPSDSGDAGNPAKNITQCRAKFVA